MEKWTEIISRCLGKSVARKSECLVFNIVAVDRGVKPTYLYDVGEPAGDKLTNLVQELKNQSLIHNNLNVVEISMDCLIVNVEELKHVPILLDLEKRIVDVSKSRKEPALCEDLKASNDLKAAMNVILDELQSDKVHLCALSCSMTSNVSSLFGLLLNYPVIYWYDTDGTGDNCLSMEKLLSVTVTADLTNKACMFSIVESYEAVVQGQSVYSFSYPSSLQVYFKPFVKKWYQRVWEKMQQSEEFSNFQINNEEKVLQAVCL